MILKKLKYTFFLIFICFIIPVKAQQTLVHSDKYKDYKIAQELYDKGKYSSSQAHFKLIIDEISDKQDEIRINSEYYFAVCALNLFHQNVEVLLTRFVLDHPDHPKSENVYFQLARHYYRLKKFSKAILYFDKVDQYDLTGDEWNEYLFKIGYSKFVRKKRNEAKVHFNEVLQRESVYKEPATYYYSHIAYEDGKYQTALNGFRSIDESPMFKAIIPYYVTQILYKQNKFDELIDYAPIYLDSVTEKKKGEFSKLIGDSYYQKQNYNEAIKYYKTFKKFSRSDRKSNYQIAYSYYSIGDYEKAIPLFARVATRKDILTQTAYYHLADAYLKTNEKGYARNAFQAASDLSFDEDIKRNSLFNYAKLAYEQSYNPYDEATNAFHDFIEEYPDTEDAKEAYEFLLKVYLTTKNYDQALSSLEKIKNKDPRMQKAYQSIVFNRAVELFHNRKYERAKERFEMVSKYPIDKQLNALSEFWKAECDFNLGRFQEAIDNYQKFRYSPGSVLTSVFKDLDYHVGYAYFENSNPYDNSNKFFEEKKQKNLNQAITFFRNYIHQTEISDTSKYRKSLLRIADGYFLQKNDLKAIENYDLAISLNGFDNSYALYQKAKSQGLVQDYEGKTATLKKLTDEYPDSRYQVMSLLDLAQTYNDQSMNKESIETYLQFIKNYPNNNFVSTAYVEVGSIYLKESNYDEAEKYLLVVLDQFPDAESENQLAIDLMKEVFSQKDNLPGYYSWLSNRGIQISAQEQDSTFWQPVQLARDNGDCESQLKKAAIYLDNVSNPSREISAHYYMATCFYSLGKMDEALYHYDFIASKPNNNFYTEALYYAGELTYDNKMYKEALVYFSTLEKVGITDEDLSFARKGQMYCFNFLENNQSTIDYALKVLSANDLNPKIKEDAYLFLGNSYKSMNLLDEAISSYNELLKITNNIKAAEAKYGICEILFNQNKNVECEQHIMEMVQQKPSYDYWLAKAIILLGDNFVAAKDYFNAKHSLQSIIDNYSGPEKENIITIAKAKIEEILLLEKQELDNQPEQQEMEIDFDEIDPSDEDLFEEDVDDNINEKQEDEK